MARSPMMPLGPVVRQQHDPIAATDAELLQTIGKGRHPLEERARAQDPLAVG